MLVRVLARRWMLSLVEEESRLEPVLLAWSQQTVRHSSLPAGSRKRAGSDAAMHSSIDKWQSILCDDYTSVGSRECCTRDSRASAARQRSRSIRHASAFSIDLGHRLGCAVRTASFFMQPGATPTHVEDVNCRVKCGLQVVFP